MRLRGEESGQKVSKLVYFGEVYSRRGQIIFPLSEFLVNDRKEEMPTAGDRQSLIDRVEGQTRRSAHVVNRLYAQVLIVRSCEMARYDAFFQECRDLCAIRFSGHLVHRAHHPIAQPRTSLPSSVYRRTWTTVNGSDEGRKHRLDRIEIE